MRLAIIEKKVLLIFVCLFALVGFVKSQPADTTNAKFTQGSVTDSSTLSLSVPMGNYKGRGIDLPVALSYSSSVWRIDHINTVINPAFSNVLKQSVTQAIYSEYSMRGWKSSLDLPIIEWPKADEVYAYDGKSSTITTADGGCWGWRVSKVFIHMPDGSTHELRENDMPYNASSIDVSGTFYAVDGSRMKYVSTNATTGTLYMPDGTRYELGDTTTSPGDTLSRIKDRNGNTITYSANSRTWTDTIGRGIANPMPATAPSPEATTYAHLPGSVDYNSGAQQTYTLKWRSLANVLTPTSSGTPELRYIANYYLPTPSASPSSSNLPQPQSTAYDHLFHTEYVFGLEGDSDIPTIVVGKGQEAGVLFNPVVLAEITLPDGVSTYKFTYNVYGEIDKVEYPTGGYERYEIESPDDEDEEYRGREPYIQTERHIKNRKVSDGSDVAEWKYYESLDANYRTTQIVSPETPGTGTYTHTDIVMWDPHPSVNARYGYDTSSIKGSVVEKRSYSASSTGLSGSLLRRELTQYDQVVNTATFPVTCGGQNYNFGLYATRNPRPNKTVNIVFESGATAALAQTTTFGYDTTNATTTGVDQTSSETSGYAIMTNLTTAQTGAIGDISPGTVVKRIETQYSSDYLSANILGLPTRVTVKDGTGSSAHVVSQSEMSYDESGYVDSGTIAMPTTMKTWDSTKGASTNSSAYLTTHATFDAYGNRTVATDAKGYTITTTYDSVNHAFPETVTSAVPDSSGTFGSSTAFSTHATYEKTPGLLKSTTDINGGVTTMEYEDPLLRPTKVTAPDGHQTITIYGDGTTAAERKVTVQSQIDSYRFAEATSYYDGLGRTYLTDKTDTSDPDGHVYALTCYDDMGRVLKASNPFRGYSSQTCSSSLQWSVPEYDDLSRTKKFTMPAPSPTGSPGSVITTYGISITTGAVGTTKTITDEAGKQRTGITDALGNMVRVIEDPGGLGYVTDYQFDTLGNLRQTKQGNSTDGYQYRYFMYDSLGRVLYAKQVEQDANSSFSGTAYADPITSNNQWSVKYTYDDNSNIATTTDANSKTITATYDRLNRLTVRDYSDSAMPDVYFYYDGKGLTVSPEDGLGKTTKVSSSVSESRYTGFDNMGRVTASEQRTGSQTYTFSYGYNLAGALIQETYPSGRVVKNTIDSTGNLEQVQSKKDSSSGYFTYADAFRYNAAGAVTKMQLGNGRWETSGYNERQQVRNIYLGTTDGAHDVMKLDFEYQVGPTPSSTPDRNNGSLRKQTIYVPSVFDSEQNETEGFTAVQEYTYDDLNRLESATEHPQGSSTTTWKQEFHYDPFGNRSFVPGTGHTTTLGGCASAVCNPNFNTANDNRFAVNQGSGYPTAYDYDHNGSLKKDATGQRFDYDSESRQNSFFTASNTTGTPSFTYAYDGEGKRVKTVVGNKSTIFVYDAMGVLQAEYIAVPLSEQEAGDFDWYPKVSYLTTDHLGSPRVVTEASGAVINRKDFAAFGDETITSERTAILGYNTPEIRQDYTGYQKDEESGLEYAQARYYNPQHGRFTSVDPLTASATIRDPQSLNRYSYADNSPYNFTDPLGLCGHHCVRVDEDDGFGFGSGFPTARANSSSTIQAVHQAAAHSAEDSGAPVHGSAPATAPAAMTAQGASAQKQQRPSVSAEDGQLILNHYGKGAVMESGNVIVKPVPGLVEAVYKAASEVIGLERLVNLKVNEAKNDIAPDFKDDPKSTIPAPSLDSGISQTTPQNNTRPTSSNENARIVSKYLGDQITDLSNKIGDQFSAPQTFTVKMHGSGKIDSGHYFGSTELKANVKGVLTEIRRRETMRLFAKQGEL